MFFVDIINASLKRSVLYNYELSYLRCQIVSSFSLPRQNPKKVLTPHQVFSPGPFRTIRQNSGLGRDMKQNMNEQTKTLPVNALNAQTPTAKKKSLNASFFLYV